MNEEPPKNNVEKGVFLLVISLALLLSSSNRPLEVLLRNLDSVDIPLTTLYKATTLTRNLVEMLLLPESD